MGCTKKYIFLILLVLAIGYLSVDFIYAQPSSDKEIKNNATKETNEASRLKSLKEDLRKLKEKRKKEKQGMIDSYHNEGVAAYVRRDFKTAAEMWQKVLGLEPSHQKAQRYFLIAYKKYTEMMTAYYHGLASMQTNNWRISIGKLLNCLMINPRHEDALKYIQICYKKLEVKIKIVDQPNEEANEIGDRTLSTDDELVLYAVGFDGCNEYLGPLAVSWRSIGTLDKVNVKEKTKSIRFVPETFGTEGTIEGFLSIKSLKKQANIEMIGKTGSLKVGTGKLHYVKILDKPKFMGKEVNKVEITADDTMKLYAAGFDKKDIYIGDVPVSWSITGTIDKIKAEKSSILPFKSKKAGKGKITATAKNNFSISVDGVVVKPGKLVYIQVEDEQEGRGKEVYGLELTTDESKTFYSLGYDQHDNLTGPVKANWSATGTLERKKASKKEKFTFSPKKAHTKGTIKAYISKKINDQTGEIKVLPGAASYISIINNPMELKKIKKLNVRAGEKIELYAAAYDSKNVFLSTFTIDWVATSPSDTKQVKSKDKIELTYTKAPEEIKIDLEHPTLKAQKGFIVNVSTGPIDKIFISTDPKEYKSDTYTIPSGQKTRFYTFAEDKYKNYIGKIKSTWEVEELSGTLSREKATQVDFFPKRVGEGRLHASLVHKDGEFKSDVSVKVIPAELARIEIRDKDNKKITSKLDFYTGEDITLNAYAYDKQGNLLDMEVNWIIDDGGKEIKKEGKKYVLNFNYYVLKGKATAVKEGISYSVNFICRKMQTSKNIVVYYIYNGDTFSKIISKYLELPYIWKKVAKYVDALAFYNKLENKNLIFPKDPVKIPYFNVEEGTATTKEDLAIKVFGDALMKDLIINFQKPGVDKISPDDKLIIRDVEFLSTGEINVEAIKRRFKEEGGK